MDRLETLRQTVDRILQQMPDEHGRRDAYVHLYGVSQACVLLAMRRGEDAELAAAAGMLHDIYCYTAMTREDHAHQGAAAAREILESLGVFSAEETDRLCTAIYHHSDKDVCQAPLDEILKDADVMQHGLYAPLEKIKPREQARFTALRNEFGL